MDEKEYKECLLHMDVVEVLIRVEKPKKLAKEGKIDDAIAKNSQESVSEELKEAAFDYAEACKYNGGKKLLCVEHFKAGAKWQKEHGESAR